ncbi:hypothetical protein UT300009_30330 [Paraclostridium bifermentans]
MRKEYYDIYKSMGICVSCGKNKAVEGRVQCEDCIEKDLQRTKTFNKERKKKYARRKKDLCEAFGVCTTCMKRDMHKGKQCLECYLKRKRKYKEQVLDSGKIPRELWSEFGLCSVCGDVRHEGSKLCKKHLEIARKNAKIARNHVDRENHKWKAIKNMEIQRITYFNSMR